MQAIPALNNALCIIIHYAHYACKFCAPPGENSVIGNLFFYLPYPHERCRTMWFLKRSQRIEWTPHTPELPRVANEVQPCRLKKWGRRWGAYCLHNACIMRALCQHTALFWHCLCTPCTLFCIMHLEAGCIMHYACIMHNA